MIEPSAGVPAHIALLLNEPFNLEDPSSVRKKLRGMASELRDQAEASRPLLMSDIQDEPREFRVVLSGGLDLFGREGACQAPPCRIEYAVHVARSIALMADQVTMHDFMGEAFMDLRRRPRYEDVDEFVPDIYVLKVLEPLVKAGVLQFISPYVPSCAGCMAEFDRRVEETTTAVLSDFAGAVAVERTPEFAAVDCGAMFEPPLVVRVNDRMAKELTDDELVRLMTLKTVRAALWGARDAALYGGTLFSNSPMGLNGLLRQEGRSMSHARLQAFAGQRAAELPWVQGLSVTQTLELRQEASAALPSLREFLARNLGARPVGSGQDHPEDYVAELREQAAAVRAELAVATSRTPSLRRNATGIVGLGISALSLATESPVAALTTLLATLGLIHQIPENDGPHQQLIKAKPGYVLVAAQDILGHAR